MDVRVELLQRLPLPFTVGSRYDDIDAFASVSTCRYLAESSASLYREGDKRNNSGDVSLRVVFLGLVGCRSLNIGNRDRGRAEKRLEFVLSSRSW